VVLHESAAIINYLIDPIEDRRETRFEWKQGDGMQLHRERRAVMASYATGCGSFLNCYR
jgi:hypothetical protein